MECFKIENMTFTYPGKDYPAIRNLNFSVEEGEFLTLCGKSGCGKTTLLRLLKPSLSPCGNLNGKIYFNENKLSELEKSEEARKIGFVMQNPDSQIVTDKVWHELAFGLESLGLGTEEIRMRVSEMASFFGIQNWFHKDVTELSGGQKQLLNLASVMVMQPDCLILDEPTSQLDPIAASEFLKTLDKINKELGTTVILSEHRLEEVMGITDRVMVMEEGEILTEGTPADIYKVLKEKNHGMYLSLPVPMRVFASLDEGKAPVNIRDGIRWLKGYSDTHECDKTKIPKMLRRTEGDIAIELENVYFRYEKDMPDVISDLNLKIKKGEIYSILGGNGAGKTTAMKTMGGILKPYSGRIKIFGKDINKFEKIYNTIGILPQNPEILFTEENVKKDLQTVSEDEELIKEIAKLCDIEKLLQSHPYDLSGGEKQRAALAKILIKNPDILLLDEPTKGMDGEFKEDFSRILIALKNSGKTIVLVSHDIEFCANCSDCCAMFFDGGITSEGEPRTFFRGKNFYTTDANRMARSVLPEAVLAEDIVKAFDGKMADIKKRDINIPDIRSGKNEDVKGEKKLSVKKNILKGCIFLSLFLLVQIFLGGYFAGWKNHVVNISSLVLLSISLTAFFPQKEIRVIKVEREKNAGRISILLALLATLVLIPLTLWLGTSFFENKKYYLTSLLVIVECFIPFIFLFEKRKPSAREIVIISVLAALAVAGRSAFFMVAGFKPVLALIIITGVAFGGETGFLVGAVTAFVSNFFFGHGPYTPWQMFALAISGFLAGVIFDSGFIKKTRLSLASFGAFTAIFIHGLIVNTGSIFTMYTEFNKEMFVSVYLLGLPFDAIYAASTFIFLWFMSDPMLSKLERIKIKYGLIKK